MFDKFFEKHKPEDEAVPSAESVGRIEAGLRGKLTETTFKEEKPMKKSIIKRVMLIAAAAAAAASALIFSATADYEGDDKYIVRINGERVDAEITTYWEGKVRFDTVMYELPCELFIDKDGKPVTEDSDVDRRVIQYHATIFSDDDHEEQLRNPRAKYSGGGNFDGMYIKNALQIPVPMGGSGSNRLKYPVYIEFHYDEDAVKEFWENYENDPENVSQKWAEKFEEFSALDAKVSKSYKCPSDKEIINDLIYERVVKKYGLEDYYTE